MQWAVLVLGWLSIATGVVRLGRQLAEVAVWRWGRLAPLVKPLQPSKPTGWREWWWASGAVVFGVTFLNLHDDLVRWPGIGIMSVILVVTFPLWDPAAWIGRRMTTPRGGQTVEPS
jgi:hypothetical protein